MEGFPYTPRPGQRELVAAVQANRDAHGHLVAEAGTGTGKTVCALAGLRGATRVIYTTRTNSQQAQVVREHHAIGDGRLLVPFMGRKHHCPLLKDDPRFLDGTADELGRLCREAKKRATQAHATGNPVDGACPYYQRLLEDGKGPVEALVRDAEDTAGLATAITEAGSCPYESLKLLLADAHVVVVPYIFLVDDALRNALMEWMGTTPDACDLVVDEAHNLPDAVRSHHSPRLGLVTIERAMKEAAELRDPFLADHMAASAFLATLHGILRSLVDEHAGHAEDGLLPPDELDTALLTCLRVPGPRLQRILQELDAWGEVVRTMRRDAGRLPRSHLGAVAAFLRAWQDVRDAPYVQLAVREPRPALEAMLLEPAARLGWLHDFASTTHMSGTLAPLDSYVAATGIRGATELVQPSPFDPERLRVYGILGALRPLGLPGEDPAITARHQALARRLVDAWTGRIGLWFPSHAMLQDYLEEGFLHGIDAVYAERSDMATPELAGLVARFLADPSPRVVLCGVLGGRLTEGLDYPGDALQHVLVMGVPYPRPSARLQALIHHTEAHHGSGWRRVVHEPTGRVMRQAIGRLIRGPEDEGTAVVLDERVMRFRDRFPGLRLVTDVGEVSDRPTPLRQGFIRADALGAA